jgi:hypothetical protein
MLVRRLATQLECDVFGTRFFVERTSSGWAAFYPIEEGKRRPAQRLLIPPDLAEGETTQYLADFCHEGASRTLSNREHR